MEGREEKETTNYNKFGSYQIILMTRRTHVLTVPVNPMSGTGQA